jgi:transposase-like protein
MTRAKSKPADGLEAHEAVEPGPPAKARRRQFTAAYKLAVLEEIDRLEGPAGAIGEVLRREGLYSSHLVDWRRQRAAGALAGLSSRRGRPAQDPLLREVGRLRQENSRLKGKLAKAERVIDVQGKVSALLHDLARESAEGSGPA